MNDEVICIDSNYPPQNLEFWRQHGVNYPKRDEIVHIRTLQRHSNGKWGMRFHEYQNPEVPVKTTVESVIYMEPSFNAKRFAKLNGDLLTEAEIKEMSKQLKEEKIPSSIDTLS